MRRALSSREKTLAWLVGGTVALIVNFFLLDFFFANHTDLRNQLTRKKAQLQMMKNLLSAGPLWEQRDAWLREHQPRLENDATAGVQLLNAVQATASRYDLKVEQQVIGKVERGPFGTTVTVDLETKSTWKALVTCLADLQKPEQFLSVDSAGLRVDGSDATQMRGKFRVTKWYAP